ncbi:MAG: hypothetical protein SFU25_11580 [Candidatus Caenarcaniphilales bacterium]|nr:hypothetical protein [Candidatus Caenarcaniphilales bacterium]
MLQSIQSLKPTPIIDRQLDRKDTLKVLTSKNGFMNNTKAYAAASANSPLTSTTIPRRDLTE